jgi:hypothetical protein
LIFRGLNFSRNADIGQIGHLWMDTSYLSGPPGKRANRQTAVGVLSACATLIK